MHLRVNFDLQTMPQEDPEDINDALDALVMKCRDKDSQVRHASLRCLGGIDRAVLAKSVSTSDWHALHGLRALECTSLAKRNCHTTLHRVQLQGNYAEKEIGVRCCTGRSALMNIPDDGGSGLWE